MLFKLSSQNINDKLVADIVQLTTQLFLSVEVVCSGGIFALHGLVEAVDHRIIPHLQSILTFITCAITDVTKTDESGMRNSAGLISDLASSLGNQISPYSDCLL